MGEMGGMSGMSGIEMETTGIRENICRVNDRIRKACAVSGRKESDVTLIAVSKTKPLSMLQEAYACGCRHFGENKVQELVEKYDQMPKDVKWHMIGHLQRNKVKYIVDKVCLIHSVDSLRLAEEISKEAGKKGVTAHILVEVNIAAEETKFGTAREEAVQLVKSIAALPSVRVKGLMTIAPYVENPEKNREYFADLYDLSVDIMRENIDNINMDVLSMGMTGDYEVAIEEWAPYVRVGTGIFGERHYGAV